MKFVIHRTSDWDRKNEPVSGAILENGEWTIEINTLEELIELQSLADKDIVIGRDYLGKQDIEIYDDYRE